MKKLMVFMISTIFAPLSIFASTPSAPLMFECHVGNNFNGFTADIYYDVQGDYTPHSGTGSVALSWIATGGTSLIQDVPMSIQDQSGDNFSFVVNLDSQTVFKIDSSVHARTVGGVATFGSPEDTESMICFLP